MQGSLRRVCKQARRCAIFAVILVGTLAIADPSFAQEKFPSKPINMVIGYGAGGSTDISTRPIALAAGKILGQPVVIVNKPGGASSVALLGLKTEKPDGYTIGTMSPGGFLAPYLRKAGYDPIKDFTHIMQFSIYQYGLVVRSESPWKSLKELIEYARANPGKVRYSTSGVGNAQHLVMERLAIAEKIKWTLIPYESGEEAVTALLGGHVEAASQTTTWKKYVESGRFRLLAFYGEKRMPDYANTPTLIDLGYNITAIPEFMVITGPKGMPPQIVETLHQGFKKAMEDPDFIRITNSMDAPPSYRGPQDLAKRLVEARDALVPIIENLGLRK
jgi:tripartite-type tricarboxylate transporter receptor subunit TctC